MVTAPAMFRSKAPPPVTSSSPVPVLMFMLEPPVAVPMLTVRAAAVVPMLIAPVPETMLIGLAPVSEPRVIVRSPFVPRLIAWSMSSFPTLIAPPELLMLTAPPLSISTAPVAFTPNVLVGVISAVEQSNVNAPELRSRAPVVVRSISLDPPAREIPPPVIVAVAEAFPMFRMVAFVPPMASVPVVDLSTESKRTVGALSSPSPPITTSCPVSATSVRSFPVGPLTLAVSTTLSAVAPGILIEPPE